MDWRYRAACRDVDPELFFPIGSSGPALIQIDEAKAVCAVCPVRSRCETFGAGEYDGVWGGLTAAERRLGSGTGLGGGTGRPGHAEGRPAGNRPSSSVAP
ncbi:WhiB family transcriptional regulator [Streptomyces abyssalis]|uniref:WhiB family transcriptional regulator n=1 Tax=Streptomyces abyssalis TaxID=933944 RepID=UPI00085CA39B|nr:WhiB family transcriptional regulator [Streptomyces abyssalis]